MVARADESWHRLLEWTQSAAHAERLAAQILHAEGFEDIDPSHPLGGPDGGVDIACTRNGEAYVAAVHFPRGQRPFSETKSKFEQDFAKVDVDEVAGFVFVTNQELRLAERAQLREATRGSSCELLHLERVAGVLDRPDMHGVREQFLLIEPDGSEGTGGRGGRAHVAGRRSQAFGGRGGRGGLHGRGGSGGDAEVTGDESLAVGGDGGDAGGVDGSGGRGGGTALERDMPMLASLPTRLWGAGRGGRGADHPEYVRRLDLLASIREYYFTVFPDCQRYIDAGVERTPASFVNARLAELGEAWQVAEGREGLELPPLSAE